MSDHYTIPSNLTVPEFGKVNVTNTGNELDVDVTILMEPQGQKAEGWRTGVALDASSSMKNWYGRVLEGKVPPDVTSDYEKKGWITSRKEDGRLVKSFQREAYEDALQKGYLQTTPNIVQPLAQKFISYLAGNLDANGGTSIIYWACGTGSELEILGDFTEAQCSQLTIEGPKKIGFGLDTVLTPAVQYFVRNFPSAQRSMFIFVTDGKIDDLDNLKKYTTQLAQKIASGKQNFVKCVLIGVGDEVDESQMLELDDLDTGTDIDIWDHKIAQEMRSLVEIFAEVVDENQIVAPTGFISDYQGNLVKKYTDGLPAKIFFSLPVDSQFFELEVAGQKIRQEISQP